jgi:hypothetical protein
MADRHSLTSLHESPSNLPQRASGAHVFDWHMLEAVHISPFGLSG